MANRKVAELLFGSFVESSLVDSKAAVPTGSKELNCGSAGLLCRVEIVGMLLTVVEGPRRSLFKNRST